MHARNTDARRFRGVVAGLRAEDPRWFHAHGGLLRALPGSRAKHATCATALALLVWGVLGVLLPLVFAGILLAMLWGTWQISSRPRRAHPRRSTR